MVVVLRSLLIVMVLGVLSNVPSIMAYGGGWVTSGRSTSENAPVQSFSKAATAQQFTQLTPIDFSLGAAVNYKAFASDKAYREVLVREYNRITPENVLKWGMSHYARSKYDFKNADRLVNFANKNRMVVKGHTLVWYGSLPDWVKKGNYRRNELKKILREHIETYMTHFKGRVAEWDVVNEAISPDGSGLRKNIWTDTLGKRYIEWAFKWAHKADPSAKLFYNDYNTEDLSRKSNTQYQLLKYLVRRRVPIDGVGLQMHLKLEKGIDLKQLKQNIQRLADLGLIVHISEMDIDIQKPWSLSLAEKEKRQAKLYQDVLSVCLEVKGCESLTTWGFTDKYTWRPNGHPLPFDKKLKPKPAYFAIHDRLLH